MSSTGLHYYVSGIVQGVFYRANTQRKAIELGLKGWVRNLADGRVEVLAFGNPDQLEIFTQWLWQGPARAKVTAVDVSVVTYEEFPDFSVR